MSTNTLVLAVLPLVVIQVGLQIYALYDIYRNGGTRPPLPTWAWVVIVAFGELIGVILYFVLGRRDEGYPE